MTYKLYDENSYIKDFNATVLDCQKGKSGYEIILDKTEFFPEGGGQSADTGFIGNAKITDVQEIDGKIIHYSNSSADIGKEYECSIDWDQRYRRMQNHSGEHVVSGIAHRMFKCTNVGFHMGNGEVTVDFDKKLSADQLETIEKRANDAVFKNAKITAYYPEKSKLAKMRYRSKLDLEDNVRIVNITGIDRCACCAPHVKRTGEIGIIKIISFQNYKGGVRLNLLCGYDAFDDYCAKAKSISKISLLLSAKPELVSNAVERLLSENGTLKAQAAELKKSAVETVLGTLNKSEGNICVFVNNFDNNQLRQLANGALELCSGICGVFSENSGHFSYVIASRSIDLRQNTKYINEALCARGGGSSEMISGSANAKREVIRSFIENFEL